ncbi:MAG: hypothetical protein HYY44_04110, partial [Deltaproteobacteria bacterium]|nr:hypothetical protein [Deltaproteobacteria bacterium]
MGSLSHDGILSAARLLTDWYAVDLAKVDWSPHSKEKNKAAQAGAEERKRVVEEIGKAHLPEENILTRGDLFRLLSKGQVCSPKENIKCEKLLRLAVGFPEEDPEGVKLSFQTVDLSNRGQVGVLKIEPVKRNEKKSPIVFVGGLGPMTIGVYLPLLAALSRLEGRPVYAFTPPGMPESTQPEGTKIGPDLIYESYLKVVKATIPEEGHFVAMGHSLGTAPIRHLYFHPDDLSQVADQYVMVTPIPAEREAKAGYSFNPLFLQGSGLLLLAGIDLRPMSLIDGLALLSQVSQEPMLDVLASQDPKLIWILVGEDHLFPTDNLEEWSSSNVRILRRARHPFLLNSKESERWAHYLSRVLREGVDKKRPRLNPDRLITGIRSRFFLQGGLNSGIEGKGEARVEANWTFEPHFEASLGVRGGIEGGGDYRLPVTASLEPRISPDLDLPLTTGLGIEQGYDLRNEERRDPFAYGFLRYELHRAIQFGLKVGSNLAEENDYKPRP